VGEQALGLSAALPLPRWPFIGGRFVGCFMLRPATCRMAICWASPSGLLGSGLQSLLVLSVSRGGGRFGCCSLRLSPFTGRLCGFLSDALATSSGVVV